MNAFYSDVITEEALAIDRKPQKEPKQQQQKSILRC